MGTVYFYGTKEDLGQILSAAGFDVHLGPWALRISDFARNFELGYVGNITPDAPFEVRGDGYGVPVDTVATSSERLAECLKRSDVAFDFAHFSGDEREIREYKYGRPASQST